MFSEALLGKPGTDRRLVVAPGMIPATHVVGLPADQLTRSGGGGQGGARGGGGFRGVNPVGECLEGERQQGVAGEDGQRLAEDLMAGGPPATQIVVVHRRQIVVHERIGVNHLDGAGRRHGRLHVAAACLRGQQRQHRSQAFSRRQQAVAHGLDQFGGAARRQLGATVQGRLDLRTKPAGAFGQRRG